jgi:hypothetical protein
MLNLNPNSFIAPLTDVKNFLTDLKHVLTSEKYDLDILPRKKDEDPLDLCTTENTMLDLDYDTDDIKDELLSLTEKDYLETILDDKGSSKPPFWVFGKAIKCKDVYIKVKIRDKARCKIFCVSFHYSRFPLKDKPYI